MGIGLFQRTRKVSKSMSPAPTRPDTVSLRVLVDSGPNAREVFDVVVNGHDTVDAIRSAVANHIGHNSMSLFKVSLTLGGTSYPRRLIRVPVDPPPHLSPHPTHPRTSATISSLDFSH
jgi:hypothetical protein